MKSKRTRSSFDVFASDPVTDITVTSAISNAWANLKLALVNPVLTIKPVYTVGDLFNWLAEVDKRLCDDDYERVKEFIEQVNSIKWEIDTLMDPDIKEFKRLNCELRKLNRKIQEVCLIIIEYVHLLHSGWTDTRSVVSLQDIRLFVEDNAICSTLIKSAEGWKCRKN